MLALFLADAVALAATPSWSELSADDGWKYDAQSSTDAAGDVDIYARDIEGIPCFKAVSQVGGLVPQELMNVVMDVKATTRWSTAGITASELLSDDGSTLEYYQYLTLPTWTLANDRFWFLKGTIDKVGSALLFHWDRLPDGGDHATEFHAVRSAHPSAVEPPVNVGGWIARATPQGSQLEYRICTDTGGSLPPSIAIAASRHTIPGNLSDVVREARRRHD